MTIASTLIDGPIVALRAYRVEMVARMARSLLNLHAADFSEPDAMRALKGCGYSMSDIVICIDDARQVAFQHTVEIVAKEVGKP